MENESSPLANSVSSQNKRKRGQNKYKPRFSKPGALVTFLIGEGDKPEKFTVHEEFACRVKAFDSAFNSNFMEGQTQTYRIDDTSADAFRLFAQWLYGQELDLFEMAVFAQNIMRPNPYRGDLKVRECYVPIPTKKD